MTRRRHLRLAGDHQRLGDERPDDAGLAGARDIQALERRMITNVVRRVAVRDLPEDFSLIQTDRRDAAVRRLRDRQALNRQSAAAALASASTTAGAAACGGSKRGFLEENL